MALLETFGICAQHYRLKPRPGTNVTISNLLNPAQSWITDNDGHVIGNAPIGATIIPVIRRNRFSPAIQGPTIDIQQNPEPFDIHKHGTFMQFANMGLYHTLMIAFGRPAKGSKRVVLTVNRANSYPEADNGCPGRRIYIEEAQLGGKDFKRLDSKESKITYLDATPEWFHEKIRNKTNWAKACFEKRLSQFGEIFPCMRKHFLEIRNQQTSLDAGIVIDLNPEKRYRVSVIPEKNDSGEFKPSRVFDLLKESPLTTVLGPGSGPMQQELGV